MAFRIYLDQTVVRIVDESGRNEPIQYNPGQVKYYIKEGRFIFYDGIERQDFNNHGYQDFADRLGVGFEDEDTFIQYLNGFINAFGGAVVENSIPSRDIDGFYRSGVNTVFGDRTYAKRVPQLAAQFQYPLAVNDAEADAANGGAATQENVMLKLTTANQVGSYINIQSKSNIRYIPGFEVYAFFTVVFSDPVDGQDQFFGVFDSDTGFGIGYKGLIFSFMHRRNGATDYYPLDLAEFKKINRYTLNPQKGNIYRISYGFLGFANCKLEIVTPEGALTKLYNFEYPNKYEQVHISQTFLPLRGELSNNAGDTPMTVNIGSINAGIIDGGAESEYIFARSFNYDNLNTYIINGDTELVAFRSKSIFGGITNKVASRLALLSGANDVNKNVQWKLFNNPVILNTPTWNDIDVDSVLEYSENVIIDFSASDKKFLVWNTSKIDSFFRDVLTQRFDLLPGDVAVFAIITTGLGEADLSINWRELF